MAVKADAPTPTSPTDGTVVREVQRLVGYCFRLCLGHYALLMVAVNKP
jgi:hypothetical protein